MRHLSATSGRACRGGSVLETLLVLGLVTALVLIALDRFISLRVEAERTAMEGVVQALRAAALERALHSRASGDRDNATDPLDSNPMVWLARPPLNYLGELAGPDPATIPGGQWYFDTRDKFLVYRVEHEAYFDSPLAGAARVRFKLVVDAADTLRNGPPEAAPGDVLDMNIKAVEPYTWRPHPLDVSALATWGVFGSSP